MRIITGKLYSGKTSGMMEEIRDNSGKSLVIVPELFSHAYERLMAEKTENTGAQRGEILTFRRLMNRVFAQAGGLCRTSLTEAGRFLYGYEAARRVESSLTLYRGLAEKTEMLQEVLRVLDECKCWSITPAQLLEASDFADGILSEKLKDLGQIYMAYNQLCKGQDPRDEMDRLSEKIPECTLFDDVQIYFDGFNGFTAQEMTAIEKLMQKTGKLTFLFDLDSEQWDIFYGTRRTIGRLEKLAQSHGLSVEKIHKKESLLLRPKALSHLASHLLDSGAADKIPTDDSVRLFCSSTVLSECEQAAGLIRKALRNGARYRDFVVTARDFSSYKAAAEMIFERYQIPMFLSEKTDIMEKPVMMLVTAAMDAVAEGYRYEDIFSYLKTGLTALSRDDCDRLENYVLSWRIQGGKWLKEWDMSPHRFTGKVKQEEEKELLILNQTRRKVIEPLEHLKKGFEEAKTGLTYVQALYRFLLEIQADQVIQKLAEQKEQDNELQSAAEYQQLWDVLVQAMEQFVMTEGSNEMQTLEFTQLFAVLLSQYDVATIPVSMDRVTCGSLERVCTTGIKHLILLGVNDGILPRAEESGGVLTDRDRDELIGLGIELSGTAEEKIWMEQETIYRAIACPCNSLYLSYHRYGSDGGEVSPSFLIRTAQKLLDGLSIEMEEDSALTAPSPCLDTACSYLGGQQTAVTRAAYTYYSNQPYFKKVEKRRDRKRGPIQGKEVLYGLYGKDLRMTASRSDKFYSCQFAFFMEYGLRVKKREIMTFDAPAIGTFLHYVLEHTVHDCLKKAGDAEYITEDMLEQVSEHYIKIYIEEELGGLEDKNARFCFLLRRMIRILKSILQNILEEMQDSDFIPLDFELEFSEKGEMGPLTINLTSENQMRLVGKVDRVDGYVSGDKLYLRVLDYKSGIKEFSLSDLWNGLNLQLFIYLFALQQKGLARYRLKVNPGLSKVVPAGALYIPAREPVVEAGREEPDDIVEEMRDKQLRRSGLLLGNMTVLEAMSHKLKEGSRFLPVSLKNDGSFRADASLADLEQMGRLARHMEEKLQEMGQMILNGQIQANPYYTSRQKDACQFCDYHAACQFDERDPMDKKRYFLSMDAKEFWDKIGGEKDGGKLDAGSADSN